MEDITTTAQAYSKDELAVLARHPVASEITQILVIKDAIDVLAKSSDIPRSQIFASIRTEFSNMTKIWSLLGPARHLARRLYVNHTNLFDLLDKSMAVEEALEDMRYGREIKFPHECEAFCCKKVL